MPQKCINSKLQSCLRPLLVHCTITQVVFLHHLEAACLAHLLCLLSGALCGWVEYCLLWPSRVEESCGVVDTIDGKLKPGTWTLLLSCVHMDVCALVFAAGRKQARATLTVKMLREKCGRVFLQLHSFRPCRNRICCGRRQKVLDSLFFSLLDLRLTYYIMK